MSRMRRRSWSAEWFYAFSLLSAVLASSAMPGQDGPPPPGDRLVPGKPDPRLPGAVTKAPDWIGPDPPFDVSAYFAPVPRDRNAAPLYLDALLEFGFQVAECFWDGRPHYSTPRSAWL
jgi:hypothetical protein